MNGELNAKFQPLLVFEVKPHQLLTQITTLSDQRQVFNHDKKEPLNLCWLEMCCFDSSQFAVSPGNKSATFHDSFIVF